MHKCHHRPAPVKERDIVVVPRINEFCEEYLERMHYWCGERCGLLEELRKKYRFAFLTEKQLTKLAVSPEEHEADQKNVDPADMRKVRRIAFEYEQAAARFWFELREQHNLDLEDEDGPEKGKLGSIYLRQPAGSFGYCICRYDFSREEAAVKTLLNLCGKEIPAGKSAISQMPAVFSAAPPPEKMQEFFKAILDLKMMEEERKQYMQSSELSDEID